MKSFHNIVITIQWLVMAIVILASVVLLLDMYETEHAMQQQLQQHDQTIHRLDSIINEYEKYN